MAYAETTSVPFEKSKKRVRTPYSELSDEEKARLAANSARYRDRLRIKRREQLDAARDARPVIPVWELAWAAGHFEGEGTCTITRSGLSPKTGVANTASFVSLTSTDREVIEFLDRRWETASIRTVAATARHKAKHTWRLSGERMRNFLLDIQPYLVTQKRKDLFRIALEAFDARRRGSRDPHYAETMDGYRRQMAALNKRGPIALEYRDRRPNVGMGLLPDYSKEPAQ